MLTLGFGSGFIQNRVNLDALTWDNQWTGLQFDPSADPRESLNRERLWMLGFNLGVGYTQSFSRFENASFGFAVHQFNAPNNGFYEDRVNLDGRFVFNARGVKVINDDWHARPSAQVSLQGTFQEWLIGGDVRRVLMDQKGLWRAAYAGVYFRTRDAGYVLVGMEYDQWNVGLSYDINYSDLEPASNNRGGFEISVVYILKRFVPPIIPRKVCPDYL